MHPLKNAFCVFRKLLLHQRSRERHNSKSAACFKLFIGAVLVTSKKSSTTNKYWDSPATRHSLLPGRLLLRKAETSEMNFQ